MSKYTDKANQFIKDADAINKFVNGTDTENVTLPNGETTSSMRKLAKDTVEYLNDAGNHYTKTETDTKNALLSTHDHVMSKAEFESLTAQRREEFAGSGVVKYGHNRYGGNYTVSKGMFVGGIGFEDTLLMGDTIGETTFNVNGILTRINDTAVRGENNFDANILLPSTNLPTIESDSSNLSKDYKQGDNILLNDTSRELFNRSAFSSSGRISSYTYTNGDNSITIEDDTSTISGYVSIRLHLIPGVKYHLSFKADKTADAWDGHKNFIQNSATGDVYGTNFNTLDTQEFIFTATQGTYLVLYASDDTFTYSELSVKQLPNQKLTVTQDTSAGTDIYTATSKIIIVDSFSRQDLIFLESWHEEVVEKDIVYPYGNVQYRGNDTDDLSGIADGSFTGADTYSLFGNWQEAGELVGKGYVLSSLSEEDKRKFASNPENNIYLDGEKYIQARNRVRVIKGLNNDLSGMHVSGSYKLTKINIGGLYDLHLDVGTNSVRGIPGKLLILEPDGNMYIVDRKDYRINDFDHVVFISKSYKKPALGSTVVILSETPIRYKTNTVSIGNIQRRNQGVYHPVYNPEGCARVYDDGNANFWYESEDLINSVEDCFDHNKIAVVSIDDVEDASALSTLEEGTIDGDVYKQTGLIVSTVSGRPDGLFADEVNERDVEDLRMDAHKVTDYKGYLEQKFNDAVAGRIRGKERNVKTVTKKFQITSSGENWIGDNFGYGANAQPEWNALGAGNNSNWGYKGGSVFTDPKITAYVKTPEKIYTLDVKKYPDMAVSNTSNGRTEFRNISIDLTNAEWIMVTTYLEESYENNNTALVCDIIGDPRKIQDRVKYTGGTHSLVKGDYVKHGDNYYLSLTDRSDVDLDNDDYGNTSNWTDLGTDGTVGGYPQEWLDNGVFGTPLLVGENGDITLLSKSHESYKGGYRLKLSRKYKSESYRLSKVLVTLNGETTELPLVVNYTHIISDGDLVGYYYNKNDNTIHFNLTGTGGYDTDIEENAIIQVFYETTPSNTELARNQGVIALTDAWRLEGDTAKWGVSLYQNLINKVGVNDKLGSASCNLGLIKGYYNRPYSVNELGNYYTDVPQVDDSLISIKPYEGSRIKILPYLTSSNNRAQMNLVFKEMKFDNEDVNQDGSPTDTWGDDNKFQITDGVSTLTDDNGNTVLYGQKAIKLDRFITED